MLTCYERLPDGVGGYANDLVASEDRPGGIKICTHENLLAHLPTSSVLSSRLGGYCSLTHVVLTQVNALTAHGQGDVHPIVYEQRHIVPLRDGMETSRS